MNVLPGQRNLVEADWPRFRHLRLEDVAGACEDGAWWYMDAGTIYLLDEFADQVARAHLAHCLSFAPGSLAAGWDRPTTPGHAPDSLHHRGRAVDLTFPADHLVTAWLLALRLPRWNGVGLYPFRTPDPVLHLDTRTLNGGGLGLRSCWWVDETRNYHPITGAQSFQEALAAIVVQGTI